MMPTSRPSRSASLLVGLAGVLVVVAATAAPVPPAPATPVTQGPPGSAAFIEADAMRDYLGFIASDEMEGRRTPSRGLKTTAKFLAMMLSRQGLQPAGDDGGFLQRIELEQTRVNAAATWVEVDGERFDFGSGFLTGTIPGSGRGQAVYAGHGWVVRARGIDPYEGLDVEGRVVVVSGGGLPEGIGRSDLRGRQGPEWMTPHAAAASRGAVALIVVPGSRNLASWDVARREAVERGEIRRPDTGEGSRGPGAAGGGAGGDDAGIPALSASPELVEALFSGTAMSPAAVLESADTDHAGEPFELGRQVAFSVEVVQDVIYTQNVVAALQGTDPDLRHEHVALGAHYDHVGVGTPVNGDSIYNGADDDGSGTIAVLTIAGAFARGERPRRSLLFVWHAGEEVGMWGSRYVNEHPPVPPGDIVAQLNIDMIGRSRQPGDDSEANRDLTGSEEVYVIGPQIMSEDLGVLIARVNDAYLGLEIDDRYDRVDEPSRFFFRSDHINYARNGIPVAFFFTGVHEDYHRPSDHADKIDYAKLEKITRTIYAVARELANQAGRPSVNPDLPDALRR